MPQLNNRTTELSTNTTQLIEQRSDELSDQITVSVHTVKSVYIIMYKTAVSTVHPLTLSCTSKTTKVTNGDITQPAPLQCQRAAQVDLFHM